MAPIVEEGAQLGECKLFFTSSRIGTRCDGVGPAHDPCKKKKKGGKKEKLYSLI